MIFPFANFDLYRMTSLPAYLKFYSEKSFYLFSEQMWIKIILEFEYFISYLTLKPNDIQYKINKLPMHEERSMKIKEMRGGEGDARLDITLFEGQIK